MITLLTIWGWLLIGAAIGRVVFVRILGDAPRRGMVDRKDYYGHYVEVYGWTHAFTRATCTALACVIAWPVALPITLMFAYTGVEKLRAQREQLEADVARLEKVVRDA